VKVGWSLCIIKHHYVKAYGGGEVELHASIISTLDKSEWSVSRPCHFSPPGKQSPVPQSRSGRFVGDMNCLTLPGIEGRFLNLVCSLITYRLRNNIIFKYSAHTLWKIQINPSLQSGANDCAQIRRKPPIYQDAGIFRRVRKIAKSDY
jgi:hypothetical protein